MHKKQLKAVEDAAQLGEMQRRKAFSQTLDGHGYGYDQ